MAEELVMQEFTPLPKPALDRAFPLLVGNRTQLAALGILVAQILGLLGILTPDHVTAITEVLGPAALMTLAAKVDRNAPPPSPHMIVVPSVPPGPVA